jgi:molecular chaperone DnaJ
VARDPYEVLGVERAADEKEIRKAFRGLARELHPDVNPDPSAEERFKELAEAYEILSDSERRATYDRYGHDGLSGQGWSPGFESFGSFGDLFSAFFGGGGPAGGPRQGSDIGIAVEMTLDEAFSGVKREIAYESVGSCETCSGSGCEPGTQAIQCGQCSGAGSVRIVQRSPFGQIVSESACPACQGRGRMPEVACGDCSGRGVMNGRREIEVEIPSGISDGQRVRVSGRGHAGQAGGPPGDLYVVVQVLADERFVRDGDDLVCVVDLSIARAALGADLVIDGLDGEIEIEVPAGTQPGSVISVKGRGMPSVRGRRRGDVRAVVSVHVPQRLDDQQRASLERLAQTLPDSPSRQGGLIDRIRGALGGAFGNG